MDYKQSGVNIEAGNQAVQLIKDKVASTFDGNVLNNLGSFAGFYELPSGYKNPVLVSCTDGVGTKLKIAIDSNLLDTVGIDLVAMSVNDLICCGAKPLTFLDYIACHKLVPDQMDAIISGIVEGCKQSNCSLVGGEMAEMNDLYQPGDFDLAGFATGVVEKDGIIDGSQISPGQFVYGLASNGIHSNGYSLVRKVLTPDVCKEHGISVESLLAPTKIYVRPVLDLIAKQRVTGIAHITGGGLKENIERILNPNVDLNLDQSVIEVPEIFTQIQQIGGIEHGEMMKVFNMGVGMVVITDTAIDDPEFFKLGDVVSGSGTVFIR